MVFGTSRMKARQRKRQENRRLRKNGPDSAHLGGSRQEQDALLKDSLYDVNRNRQQVEKSRDETEQQLDHSNERETQANDQLRERWGQSQQSRSDYQSGIDSIGAGANKATSMRNDALGGATGIRNSALAQNQLTGSAESILAQRQAQLAGAPTIGQATETALAANQANANSMLNRQIGIQNRAARGLAGSMGEGGALAMQQAIASAGAGAADQASANQLQQAQLAAQMRFNAAGIQNQQDVAAADQAVALRMAAAEQERANQMGVAGANAADTLNIGNANAGNAYDASLQAQNARAALMGQDANNVSSTQGYQANLLGQANTVAGNRSAIAQAGQDSAYNDQQFKLGTAAGIDQAENQRKYEAAKQNNVGQKLISTIFDPGDLRGSGSKGFAG